MGLSDEERHVKFFWALSGWRRSLEALAAATCAEKKKIVRSWIRRIDHMSGMMVRKTDNSGGYWIFGENDNSFRVLIGDTNGRAPKNPDIEPEDTPQSKIENPKYESLRWWEEHLDHTFLAGRLGSDQTCEGLNTLATWWDAWGWVAHTCYPLFRYEDEAFPKRVSNEFERLVGEIQNRRFNLCVRWELTSHQVNRLAAIEQALLIKKQVVGLLLKEAWSALDPKTLEGYTTQFDGYAMIDRVADMSLAECVARLAAEQQAEWKRKDEYRTAEHEKKEKAPKKSSRLFGPEPRTDDELLKIVREGADYDTVKRASEELWAAHSTTVGWEHRFDPKTKKLIPVSKKKTQKK